MNRRSFFAGLAGLAGWFGFGVNGKIRANGPPEMDRWLTDEEWARIAPTWIAPGRTTAQKQLAGILSERSPFDDPRELLASNDIRKVIIQAAADYWNQVRCGVRTIGDDDEVDGDVSWTSGYLVRTIGRRCLLVEKLNDVRSYLLSRPNSDADVLSWQLSRVESAMSAIDTVEFYAGSALIMPFINLELFRCNPDGTPIFRLIDDEPFKNFCTPWINE